VNLSVIHSTIFAPTAKCDKKRSVKVSSLRTVRRVAPWFIVAAVLTQLAYAQSKDWIKAPRPHFPAEALRHNSEGSVTMRLVVTPDGSVGRVTVVKPSSDQALDQAAEQAVRQWKMAPAAVKPGDLTKGRQVVIQFREEAPVAAAYRGGVVAAFANANDILNPDSAAPWKYAPFPYYSASARAAREQGTVWLRAKIGSDGEVAQLQVLKGSGHTSLDEAAVRAVRLWRAHKEYAHRTLTFPVKFELYHRR
jgi:protein TonB